MIVAKITLIDKLATLAVMPSGKGSGRRRLGYGVCPVPSCAVWPEELIGKPLITTMFYEGAVLRNKMVSGLCWTSPEKAEQVNKDLQATAIYDRSVMGMARSIEVFSDALKWKRMAV